MIHSCVETNMDGCLFRSIAVIFFFSSRKRNAKLNPPGRPQLYVREGEAGWVILIPCRGLRKQVQVGTLLGLVQGWCLYLPKPFTYSWGSPTPQLSAPDPLGSLQMERIVQVTWLVRGPCPYFGIFPPTPASGRMWEWPESPVAPSIRGRKNTLNHLGMKVEQWDHEQCPSHRSS